MFYREKVPTAEEAAIFGQADVVGKPMVVHRDPLVSKGNIEVRLQAYAVFGKMVVENLLEGVLFGLGNVHTVGVHPPGHTPKGIVPAKFQHPSKVFSCHQLPSGTEKVYPDDLAAVVIRLKSFRRRFPGPHSHSPAHHPVFLRLHGPHPRHHIVWRGELRADKLLVKESGGNGVHYCFLAVCKDIVLCADDKIPSRGEQYSLVSI